MIRSFRVGDIVLVQRLAGQAAKLNAAQALLFPKSPSLTALNAVIPWGDSKTSTYILHQKGHQLARAGFIQAQNRARWPEADILLLAPALDMPTGHPAIWEKLVSYYLQEAASSGLERIYCDVPDSPLPVTTLQHVGFAVYSRETIWRLKREDLHGAFPQEDGAIRPARSADAWALARLYAQVTPAPIQRAEGVQPGQTDSPPLLQPRRSGIYHTFVLEAQGDVTGCVQIQPGRRGVYLRLWADTHDPDQQSLRKLLRHGLAVVGRASLRPPVYVSVRDHEGGLGALLQEHRFAPFTDRARMVKHVIQWARANVLSYQPTMEPVAEALPSQFGLSKRRPLVRWNQSRSSVHEAPGALPERSAYSQSKW